MTYDKPRKPGCRASPETEHALFREDTIRTVEGVAVLIPRVEGLHSSLDYAKEI